MKYVRFFVLAYGVCMESCEALRCVEVHRNDLW